MKFLMIGQLLAERARIESRVPRRRQAIRGQSLDQESIDHVRLRGQGVAGMGGRVTGWNAQ